MMIVFPQKRSWGVRISVAAIMAAAFWSIGFPTGSAHAAVAPAKPYRALHVVGGGTISIPPGQTKEVTMGFQNSGTKTWSRDGKNFVSVYTHGPKYRKSVFVHPTWVKNTQPAKLKELSVAPGAVGHVSFILQAPKEEGSFKETFWLAVENMAWMDGGEFTLQVNVAKPAPPPVVFSRSGEPPS